MPILHISRYYNGNDLLKQAQCDCINVKQSNQFDCLFFGNQAENDSYRVRELEHCRSHEPRQHQNGESSKPLEEIIRFSLICVEGERIWIFGVGDLKNAEKDVREDGEEGHYVETGDQTTAVFHGVDVLHNIVDRESQVENDEY